LELVEVRPDKNKTGAFGVELDPSGEN